MIIATVPIPAAFQPPRSVLANARRPRIEVEMAEVLGADEWVSCCYAMPHEDPHIGEKNLFITLSVVSSHAVGDALSPFSTGAVPRGTLFVIDPLVRHWLTLWNAWQSTKTAPWAGLQWEVPRTDAKDLAQSIVEELRGEWCQSFDARYADWIPEGVQTIRRPDISHHD